MLSDFGLSPIDCQLVSRVDERERYPRQDEYQDQRVVVPPGLSGVEYGDCRGLSAAWYVAGHHQRRAEIPESARECKHSGSDDSPGGKWHRNAPEHSPFGLSECASCVFQIGIDRGNG